MISGLFQGVRGQKDHGDDKTSLYNYVTLFPKYGRPLDKAVCAVEKSNSKGRPTF